MELNIGQNIKKLRQSKGMTQEHLAQLLSISTAAVSKWEAKNTYPDITMLLPLANIFGVTVDELMGRDSEKEKAEINSVLQEYRSLEINGRFDEANNLITKAKKSFPHDYRIMRAYMWRITGGENACSKSSLLEHYDELLQISECILDGCKDEKIRLDALNLQAKLYYAKGETKLALSVLEQFPGSMQTTAFKTEQLYPRDTVEFRYHNKKNLYGLLDITYNKMVRMYWYDDSLSLDEKKQKIESLGDTMTTLRKDEMLFAIPEQMIFAELANLLSIGDCTDDVIRIRKKQMNAMRAIQKLAETDEILRDCLIATYKTANPTKWLCDWLTNASHGQFVRLRQNQAYRDMLSEFSAE